MFDFIYRLVATFKCHTEMFDLGFTIMKQQDLGTIFWYTRNN